VPTGTRCTKPVDRAFADYGGEDAEDQLARRRPRVDALVDDLDVGPGLLNPPDQLDKVLPERYPL
jgi:hypothetical protein